MNTIDPRIARAEREQRRQGSAGQAFLAILFSLLSVMAGASVAYGVVSSLDAFRLMSINGIFDGWDSPISHQSPLFLFPGILGSIILVPLKIKAAKRFGGGLGKALKIFPSTMFGAFLISLLAPVLMTAPTTVGVNEDPTFNDPEAWGAVSWMWYAVPFVVPGVMLIVVVIMLAVGIRGVRKQTRATDLVQHGVRVTGKVIEVSGGSTLVNGMPLVTVSVQYTDRTGVVRYVTKKKPIPYPQVPVLDQKVLVIYDPADVANEKKIMLGLGASDFIEDALS